MEVLRVRHGIPNFTVAKAVVLLSFVTGIILANIIGREKISGIGILNNYFIEKFKYADINRENLFFYIVGERIPFVILIMMLTFSSLGVVAGLLNLGWQSFSIGFILSAAIIKYNAGGILLVLGGLFPQFIFYLIAYAGYYKLAELLRTRIMQIRTAGYVCKEQMRVYAIGVGVGFVLFLVFVIGVITESYFNPFILKKVLQLSCY